VDKVLNSSPMPSGIHNFVDVPLLGAVFGDNWPWSDLFTVGEEEGVVWDVSFQQTLRAWDHTNSGYNGNIMGMNLKCIPSISI